MSGPAIKVEIPEWDDARIEAIAEVLLRLVDDDGVIAGFNDQPEAETSNTRR